jgi:hypothetical protein
MTESADTKQRYQIRLLERCAFYDDVKTHQFRDFPAGTIISDPAVIGEIETRGALVEKIIEQSETGDQK